ncbi:MAG TPA: tyrosine-type recombinase/integrase [Longimicrobiaceae bacterium]|jgi:integrase|nr:tyrosine-type recombinase/integrase [Longimicrobiaceae bacterium]
MSKNGSWSYNTGVRGINWVRAYEDGRGGIILLEWFQPKLDGDDQPVFDKKGKPVQQKKRASTSTRDRVRAKKMADEAAEIFALQQPGGVSSSLRRLMYRYLQEVTQHKGKSRQKQDKKAVRVFLAYFAEQGKDRGPDRDPASLDRKDWEGFSRARREGVTGFGPCKANQIRTDLKFLIAVLAWAAGAEEGAVHWIRRHPWSAERRRSQRMVMPTEKNPIRPGMGETLHDALLRHSPDWRFSLVLELCRETMHRGNSVRQLQWSDVDLGDGVVLWRGEFDKTGREIVTPLSPRALAALQAAPRVLGSPWVASAPKDPTRPVSSGTLNKWMEKAKAAAGIEVPRLGFHAQKRAGVRTPEFRALPDKVQEQLTGTTIRTLREVYDDITVDELREAMDSVAGARRRA